MQQLVNIQRIILLLSQSNSRNILFITTVYALLKSFTVIRQLFIPSCLMFTQNVNIRNEFLNSRVKQA